MSTEIKTQVVVLGAGPAGYSAAFRAADLGLETVIVERYSTLGGVCLNVGCIPSKALLHVAKVIEEAKALAEHGIVFGEPKTDIDKIRTWKEKVITQLTGGLAGMAKGRKVKVVNGLGKFTGANTLEVEGENGKTVINFDNKVTAVEAKEDGIYVSMEGKKAPSEPQRYDAVLVAIGRVPNGKNLDAGKAGVEVDDRGFIRVDKQLRTNVPHIFAIGDIVGQPMLAHKGVHEGHVAAEVIAGMKHYFDPKVIPSIAYTEPEVAWVGLTEKEAKEKGISYETATFPCYRRRDCRHQRRRAAG